MAHVNRNVLHSRCHTIKISGEEGEHENEIKFNDTSKERNVEKETESRRGTQMGERSYKKKVGEVNTETFHFPVLK